MPQPSPEALNIHKNSKYLKGSEAYQAEIARLAKHFRAPSLLGRVLRALLRQVREPTARPHSTDLVALLAASLAERLPPPAREIDPRTLRIADQLRAHPTASFKEIAQMVNRSKQRVHQVAKKLGIERQIPEIE